MRLSMIAVLLAACGGSNPTLAGGLPIDAADPVECPNRTAAVGQPQTTPAAGEIALGDVTVRTALDVAGLAGKKVITGSLTIETTELATVALPDLEVVQGSLTIR